MPRQIAVFLYVLFILWLFLRHRKERGPASRALWIPLIWIAILGSRPASAWLGVGVQMESADDYLEGSSFDRNIFMGLIAAGLWVLAKRRVSLRSLISNNRWLFLFYLFFGLSAFWSDHPFVTFKRWFKDLGNVIMVLVILSEKKPVEAVKTVFLWSSYLLIPLSVVFIKYYPDLGRGYDHWTWEPIYQGVAIGKNALGSTVAVCGLFVFWEFLQRYQNKPGRSGRTTLFNLFLLFLMVIWLLRTANSATSLACTILGCGGLVALNLPAIKERRRHIITYCVVGAFLLMLLSTAFDLQSNLIGMLGRDPTLTGRTDIWKMLLAEKINPLFGTGFYSFWLGTRVEKFWNMYSFHLNQAHNGYLETYLDGGLIGVGLLIAMLVSTGKTIQKRLVVDDVWGSITFIFWLLVIVHNWTEASFGRLDLLWFVLLLVAIQCPPAFAAVRAQPKPRLQSPFEPAGSSVGSEHG